MSGSQDLSVCVSVKDELYDLLCRPAPGVSDKNLAKNLFEVPENRSESQVFRFTCAFNKIFVSVGGEKVLLDLSGFSQETPNLLNQVIENISNLSSGIREENLSLDQLELLRNFIINIDYYKVQTILDTFFRTKWESVADLNPGSFFIENCLSVVSKCDLSIDFTDSGSIDATYRLSDFELKFLDNYQGNPFLILVPEAPSLEVITNFCKEQVAEIGEDIVESDRLIISSQEDGCSDRFCLKIEDIELLDSGDSLNSLSELSGHIVNNVQSKIFDFTMRMIALHLGEPTQNNLISLQEVHAQAADLVRNANQELVQKKKIDIPWFMVKFFGLNSVLFATYAAISTYAQVGVIAGLTAATGPIGIAIAASIFILSACALLYRRYCKNNARVPIANAPVANAAGEVDPVLNAPVANAAGEVDPVLNAAGEVDAGLPQQVNTHQPVQLVFQEAKREGSIQEGSMTSGEVDSVLGAGLPDEDGAPVVVGTPVMSS